MGMVRWTGIASVLLASQVFAESIVNYTVELSPYNQSYVTAWKGGTNRILFPSGNPDEGQQFSVGDVITWDVVAALDPNEAHSQPGHASDGKKPYGIANVVVNLELTDAVGGPVSTGVFFSAVNDGNDGDPLAAAAFAASFNFINKGPGRLIDQVSGTTDGSGGPNMALSTYPTAIPGKMLLLGQGAGYVQWKRTGATNATITVPGVGLVTLPGPTNPPPAGLGILPLFEGQIDTTNMAPGTYNLKVIPGAGVNVLRGDYTDFLSTSKDAFAVAANVQHGDEITFTLVPAIPVCQVPPVITSAVSNRTHGASNVRGIVISPAAPVTIETRSGGVQQVVVTYDRDIKAADGTLDTEVTLSAGGLNGPPIIAGDKLTINTANVPDRTCLAITIDGITCVEGGAVAPATTLKLVVRMGDANHDGLVNSADALAIKPFFSPFPVTDANAAYDVNMDNIVTAADSLAIKPAFSPFPTPQCQY